MLNRIPLQNGETVEMYEAKTNTIYTRISPNRIIGIQSKEEEQLLSVWKEIDHTYYLTGEIELTDFESYTLWRLFLVDSNDAKFRNKVFEINQWAGGPQRMYGLSSTKPKP
jgi:hypothetical protein